MWTTEVFFLNQQFITQGVRADHGSYFVTMYKTNKLYKERNRKRKKDKKKRSRKRKRKKIQEWTKHLKDYYWTISTT